MYKIEIFTDQFEYASACLIGDEISIELDYLAYDSYKITTPIKDCKKGYFVHITDEDNNFVADGVVGDVQPNDYMQDISIRPLNTLFDSEVFYTPVSDCILWLATNIDEAYMHNTDTLQNRPISLTYTQSANNLPLTGYNLHDTVNILSVMVSALKTYGVVVQCRLDLPNKRFNVNVFQQTATKTLEASLDNVLDKSVTIGDSYGSTNKAVIRKTQVVDDSTTVLGQTEFYLHPDGSIDTDNTNRIIPVFFEIESLEFEDDMTETDWQNEALARAKEILEPAKYDNEIDLTYGIEDQLARPMEIEIGTATTIYLEGETYSSILTGKRIQGKEVTLIFGVTRTELSKKLSMEKRETMTFENTVSAVLSQAQTMFPAIDGHGGTEIADSHADSGYIKIIHVECLQSYADGSLEWEVDTRWNDPLRLCLVLNGESTATAQTVKYFLMYHPFANGSASYFHIASLGNGQFDIYADKSAYDIFGVKQTDTHTYMADKVKITYPMTFHSTAVSGWTDVENQSWSKYVAVGSTTTGLNSFNNGVRHDKLQLNNGFMAYMHFDSSGTRTENNPVLLGRIGDVIVTSTNTNPQTLYGGTWTAMPKNYASYKYPNSIANGAWNHSLTITTSGGAVFLNMNGNINPLNAGGWVQVHIKRDGTEIVAQTVQSPSASHNIPYSISYIDVPSAGSHTYNFSMTVGAGTIQNNENGANYTPQMMAFELGASSNLYFWKRTA